MQAPGWGGAAAASAGRPAASSGPQGDHRVPGCRAGALGRLRLLPLAAARHCCHSRATSLPAPLQTPFPWCLACRRTELRFPMAASAWCCWRAASASGWGWVPLLLPPSRPLAACQSLMPLLLVLLLLIVAAALAFFLFCCCCRLLLPAGSHPQAVPGAQGAAHRHLQPADLCSHAAGAVLSCPAALCACGLVACTPGMHWALGAWKRLVAAAAWFHLLAWQQTTEAFC